jgi:hypothetical protein
MRSMKMKPTRATLSTALTIVAALILLAAIPSAVRDTLDTGRCTCSRASSSTSFRSG